MVPIPCLRKKYQLPMTRLTKAKAPRTVSVAIDPVPEIILFAPSESVEYYWGSSEVDYRNGDH